MAKPRPERPVYVQPERRVITKTLLHESKLFELEPLESAALIHKTYTEAYQSGLYSEITWEQTDEQSYDGCWYEMVGKTSEADADYRKRVDMAIDHHNEKTRSWIRKIEAQKKQDLASYNRIAEENGWPLAIMDSEGNIKHSS